MDPNSFINAQTNRLKYISKALKTKTIDLAKKMSVNAFLMRGRRRARQENQNQNPSNRPHQRMRMDREFSAGGGDNDIQVTGWNLFGGGNQNSSQEDASEAVEAGSGPPEKERFVPVKTRNRQLEEERLGLPGSRARCFGCVYVGETKCAAIPQADLRKLLNMARKSVGQTDLLVLCEAMAEFYAKFRRKVNRTRVRGAEKLPRWSAAMIMDHMRNHTHDPQIKQVVQLCDINELTNETLEGIMEVSSKSGKKRANKDQAAVYEKFIKLYWTVSKVDPSKMAFYSAGARMDPQTASSGFIASGTKNLIDYWKETANEY